MAEQRLLVVGAHSADFVWRAAGTIALTVAQGGKAQVVALSYGERGESGELWKQPGQTVENVKRIRHAEAEQAAAAIGATFRCLDLGDYPLVVDGAALAALVDLFREWQPAVVLTHTPVDPFNPDHPVASEATQKARLLSAGAGVSARSSASTRPTSTTLSPTSPSCAFAPNTFVDITPVFPAKLEAMAAMKAQEYLQTYYTELAGRRANHARRMSGKEEIRYAEAFQRTLPWVVNRL